MGWSLKLSCQICPAYIEADGGRRCDLAEVSSKLIREAERLKWAQRRGLWHCRECLHWIAQYHEGLAQTAAAARAIAPADIDR